MYFRCSNHIRQCFNYIINDVPSIFVDDTGSVKNIWHNSTTIEKKQINIERFVLTNPAHAQSHYADLFLKSGWSNQLLTNPNIIGLSLSPRNCPVLTAASAVDIFHSVLATIWTKMFLKKNKQNYIVFILNT